MPAKNTIKQYIEDGNYHLYNRGVEKRDIFLDEEDYSTFLYFLKRYLDPSLGSDPKSLSAEISLYSFCLMPNHFHLQVKQKTKYGITKLMRAICTNYVMYFNRKYNRVGGLFQGKYKAAMILDDTYLLHLSRYIHLNPYPGSDPSTYPYSSYSYCLGYKKAAWLNTSQITSFFKTAKKTHPKDCLSYQSFVEDYKEAPGAALGELALES